METRVDDDQNAVTFVRVCKIDGTQEMRNDGQCWSKVPWRANKGCRCLVNKNRSGAP